MKKTTSHKELIEQFIEFETEKELFDWRIDRVPIWELLRIEIFDELQNKLSAKKDISKKKNWRSFITVLDSLKNYITKNPFNANPKDILFLSHPRRKLKDGFYEEIYIDPLLENLKNNYNVVEGFVSADRNHYKPTKTNNLYYFDSIQLTSRIIGSLPTYRKLQDHDKNKIEKLELDIWLGWGVKIRNIEKRSVKIIKRWKYACSKIEKLIEKLNPKKIVLLVSYSFMNKAVTYAAKKRKIPVFELQHGVVGKYHIAYNYANIKQDKLETFPDFFFAWGEKWVDQTRMPIPKKNLKLVGFPYFENYKSEKEIKRNNKQLLFISQLRRDIAYFAKETAELLPTYKILFKAHPIENMDVRDRYPFLVGIENIEIVTDNTISLYDLFKQSSLVLGVNSTAIIEAIAFCPSVLIMKLSGWEYFEYLEEDKNIQFVSTPYDVKSFLQKNKNVKISDLKKKYFEEDSIKKICAFLDQD